MTSNNVYTVCRREIGSARLFYTQWHVIRDGFVISRHATREKALDVATQFNRDWIDSKGEGVEDVA